jgi:hypothetical protein
MKWKPKLAIVWRNQPPKVQLVLSEGQSMDHAKCIAKISERRRSDWLEFRRSIDGRSKYPGMNSRRLFGALCYVVNPELRIASASGSSTAGSCGVGR